MSPTAGSMRPDRAGHAEKGVGDGGRVLRAGSTGEPPDHAPPSARAKARDDPHPVGRLMPGRSSRPSPPPSPRTPPEGPASATRSAVHRGLPFGTGSGSAIQVYGHGRGRSLLVAGLHQHRRLL